MISQFINLLLSVISVSIKKKRELMINLMNIWFLFGSFKTHNLSTLNNQVFQHMNKCGCGNNLAKILFFILYYLLCPPYPFIARQAYILHTFK